MQRIIYENTPESFFNAVLKKHLQAEGNVVLEQRSVRREPDLFSWQDSEVMSGGDESDEAEELNNLKTTIVRYLRIYGGSGPFCEAAKFQRFCGELFFCLRHCSSGKMPVAAKVTIQVMKKGLSFVLEKVSEEGRVFRRLASEVRLEIHRAKAFMRLLPFEDQKILFGEFECKHDTVPLIVEHFQRRFPDYGLLLLLGSNAYFSKDNTIEQCAVNRRDLKLSPLKNEFLPAWLAFYQSQYIPQRKNSKLFKRRVPERYRRFMDEMVVV